MFPFIDNPVLLLSQLDQVTIPYLLHGHKISSINTTLNVDTEYEYYTFGQLMGEMGRNTLPIERLGEFLDSALTPEIQAMRGIRKTNLSYRDTATAILSTI